VVAVLDRSKDATVCRGCLEQLLLRVGVSSTPTLPVLDIRKAVEFYKVAGFGTRVWKDGASEEPGFAFVDFEGQSVFDLDHVPGMDPGTNGAGCYIIARDVDGWHSRMSTAGLPVTAIRDEPWGMHEFTLTDPNGNRIRVGHALD
jgi:uncharacterized glyoxalase superfamily protein PhnB